MIIINGPEHFRVLHWFLWQLELKKYKILYFFKIAWQKYTSMLQSNNGEWQ